MPDARVLHRVFNDICIRSEGDGRTIAGVAVPFNVPTDIGPYVESFRRGAFARTIAERGPMRVKVLASHNEGQFPIGRASLLREDPGGLYAELKVSKTQAGDEALELVRDGALDGLSIGFTPVSDDRSRGVVERTEVRLHEISVVAWPAYDTARIAHIRSEADSLASTDYARRRQALVSILNRVTHE